MISSIGSLRFWFICWLGIGVMGCNRSKLDTFLPEPNPEKCVQIFYDQAESGNEDLGPVFAGILKKSVLDNINFPISIQKMSAYKQGQLNKCVTNFYIANVYDAPQSMAFLADFQMTKSNVVWMGYSYWKLGPALEEIFGVHFESFEERSESFFDAQGNPGFFRDIFFRGKVFKKFAAWDEKHENFIGSCEVGRVSVRLPGRSQILASIRHSITGEFLPYLLKSNNRYLFLDNPLVYEKEQKLPEIIKSLMPSLVE